MPAILDSFGKASISLTGAAAIALSPLGIPDEGAAGTASGQRIELLAASAPALGGPLYEVMVNQFGNFLALYPIVLGSTAQCTVCEGPAYNSDYTGWGLAGVVNGLIQSVPAFLSADSFISGLGEAGLAIQTPIINTYSLLGAERNPDGGFQFIDTFNRAVDAATIAVSNIIKTAYKAFVAGPYFAIGGIVEGLGIWAETLAETGSVVEALRAGLHAIAAGFTYAVANVANTIQTGREALYAELTSGPEAATHPIPTVGSQIASRIVAASPDGSQTRPAQASPESRSPRASLSAAGSAAAPVKANARKSLRDIASTAQDGPTHGEPGRNGNHRDNASGTDRTTRGAGASHPNKTRSAR